MKKLDARILNKSSIASIAAQIKFAQVANVADCHSLVGRCFDAIEEVAGQDVREACVLICADSHTDITLEELAAWVKTVIIELIIEQ